jgi:tetrahydromethanopterin S-methyltransferase subunit F
MKKSFKIIEPETKEDIRVIRLLWFAIGFVFALILIFTAMYA